MTVATEPDTHDVDVGDQDRAFVRADQLLDHCPACGRQGEVEQYLPERILRCPAPDPECRSRTFRGGDL